MKPELKSLMEELQIAFNESVCESDRIAAVLADIKRVGYEVVLALEVTIGVTAAQADAAANSPAAEPAAEPHLPSNGELQLTEKDQEFLQALRIGTGDN